MLLTAWNVSRAISHTRTLNYALNVVKMATTYWFVRSRREKR